MYNILVKDGTNLIPVSAINEAAAIREAAGRTYKQYLNNVMINPSHCSWTGNSADPIVITGNPELEDVRNTKKEALRIERNSRLNSISATDNNGSATISNSTYYISLNETDSFAIRRWLSIQADNYAQFLVNNITHQEPSRSWDAWTLNAGTFVRSTPRRKRFKYSDLVRILTAYDTRDENYYQAYADACDAIDAANSESAINAISLLDYMP